MSTEYPALPLAETIASLPPVWPDDLLPLIQGKVGDAAKVVVLDDDPTARRLSMTFLC
jgi:hypothetical protein